MSDFAIIPAGEDSEYVELTQTKTGTLFRKKILHYGTLIHPKTKKKITIDEGLGKALKSNFETGKGVDMVQTPLADDNNGHSERPDLNKGEVISIELASDGVYTVMDVRDPDIAEDMRKKRIRGSSAYINMNATDTNTGKNVGPVLVHNCITNNPYVKGLGDYEEILAMSDSFNEEEDSVYIFELTDDIKNDKALTTEPDGNTSDNDVTVDEVLTQEPMDKEKNMTKEELLKALKEEHGVDVEALEATAKDAEKTASLANQVVDALNNSGALALSNSGETVDSDKVLGAVVELAKDHVELSNKVESLELSAAQAEVKRQIKDGYILPKQEKVMTNLFLTDRGSYTDMLLDEPRVELENEVGLTSVENDTKEIDVDKYTEYYMGLLDSKSRN